ncbi:hypothetical protein YB2330_002658 [Saitoella coloradoensis]
MDAGGLSQAYHQDGQHNALNSPRGQLLSGLRRGPRASENSYVPSGAANIQHNNQYATPVKQRPAAVDIGLARGLEDMSINTPTGGRYANMPRTAGLPPKTARSLGIQAPKTPVNGGYQQQQQQQMYNAYGQQLPPSPVTPGMPNQGMKLYEQQLQQLQALQQNQAQLVYLAQQQQRLQQLQQQALRNSGNPLSPSYTFVPATPAAAAATGGACAVYDSVSNSYQYFYPQQQQVQVGGNSYLPSPVATPEVKRSGSGNGKSRSVTPPSLSAGTQSQSVLRKGHGRGASVSGAGAGYGLGLGLGITGAKDRSPSPPTVQKDSGAGMPGANKEGAPIRQPHGPPNFDELMGDQAGKNFASRIRKRAVKNFGVLAAGVERRTGLSPALRQGAFEDN